MNLLFLNEKISTRLPGQFVVLTVVKNSLQQYNIYHKNNYTARYRLPGCLA
jgi:hypothetical protein